MRNGILLLFSIIQALSFCCLAQSDYNPPLPPEPNPTYKVTVNATPADVAFTSGTGRYTIGSRVYINTSVSDSDWEFKYWLKDGEEFTTSRSFYFTVGESDAVLTAVYAMKTYDPTAPDDPYMDIRHKLFLKSEPEEACSFNIGNGDKLSEGKTVNLRASPSQNFHLIGWYDDAGAKVGDNLSYAFVMPQNDVYLTARFEYNPDLPSEPESSQEDIDNPYVYATDILLDKSEISLLLQEECQLVATVLPAGAAMPELTWSSSDTSVATVTPSGKVVAVGVGTATITASSATKLSASCRIVVTKVDGIHDIYDDDDCDNDDDNEYYDLRGIRHNTMPRGIYIHKGKVGVSRR